MATLVKVEIASGRATLTLDSPENRNALSQDLLGQLLAALAAAAADDEVRVVVLRHTGSVFCSGADLKAKQAAPQARPAFSLVDVLQALRNSPKPVVGVVQGKVRAGGLGIIAACDVVLATEASDFAFTEVRLGLVPAVILEPTSAVMRPRDLRELVLTGDVFSADRAQQSGLISRCVATEELEGAIDALVTSIAAGGPRAIAMSRALLNNDDLGVLAGVSRMVFASDEARAGLAARASRGTPPWTADA